MRGQQRIATLPLPDTYTQLGCSQPVTCKPLLQPITESPKAHITDVPGRYKVEPAPYVPIARIRKHLVELPASLLQVLRTLQSASVCQRAACHRCTCDRSCLARPTQQQAVSGLENNWAFICIVRHRPQASPFCRRYPRTWLYVPTAHSEAFATVLHAGDGRLRTSPCVSCPHVPSVTSSSPVLIARATAVV